VSAKHLRLYLEYPSSVPGLALGEPRPAQWERAVVSSRFFAPELEHGSILTPHGCWFLPVDRGPAHRPDPIDAQSEGTNVLLALARVAGYDTAIYGLPRDTHPLLLKLPHAHVLVATSALSLFIRGRFAPRESWRALWGRLLRWLEPDADLPGLAWTPLVRVEAGPETELSDDAEGKAYRRSLKWFREHVVYSIDWKKGAIEGFESAIDHNGYQLRRPWVRGDCTAETGMVLACDWAFTRDPASRQMARQILDYVWSSPDFHQDDPHSPAYGLNNWYERGPVFYGDDNARVILSTLAARNLLSDDRWDERVMRCTLANLRTTGPLGFRRDRIDLHHLLEAQDGWKSFHRQNVVSYAPHYQAYLWAAYLLAYALTGFDDYLERTTTAVRMTMAVYPDWRWTNGITQELARMLLPLAFLVRIEDTPEHRRWLARVAGDLLAEMQPCGAIRERLGPLENGRYPPPQSNEAYGTAEASLIQANGDPACDLLYTANYAFLGLHEAAEATGDAELRRAEDRLASYLCRIQVRSESHPYLDGAWMRGFDDARWEYWGSSSDAGWGAWSVESGWTNTWIATVLAMRRHDESLYDLCTASPIGPSFAQLVAEMLGDPQ
jgi:hypothetical protein